MDIKYAVCVLEAIGGGLKLSNEAEVLRRDDNHPLHELDKEDKYEQAEKSKDSGSSRPD